MSIKDKINSLIGNFEDETIVDEGNSNNQESASLLASDSLEKEKLEYEESIKKFEDKVTKIKDRYNDREKKIKENINYLQSEREKLEKELSQYRSNLVDAELQGENGKVDNLNKDISNTKSKIAEINERIDSYKAASSFKIKPETKKELSDLYQNFIEKRKIYQRLARKKREQLVELKKQIEEEITIIERVNAYPGSDDAIRNLSRIEHMVHDRGNIPIMPNAKKRMFRKWLEGDESYKDHLPKPKKKEKEIRKVNFKPNGRGIEETKSFREGSKTTNQK